MFGIAVVQAVLTFGMLVATGTTAWILHKQHRKASDDKWKSQDAFAFLKAHNPREGGGGPQAQEQFVSDATPPVSTGELAFLAVGVVILVGLAAWGIDQVVEGMFVGLEQRMREAGGLGPPSERRP